MVRDHHRGGREEEDESFLDEGLPTEGAVLVLGPQEGACVVFQHSGPQDASSGDVGVGLHLCLEEESGEGLVAGTVLVTWSAYLQGTGHRMACLSVCHQKGQDEIDSHVWSWNGEGAGLGLREVEGEGDQGEEDLHRMSHTTRTDCGWP